jgi:hypothetical protein
MEFTLHKLPKGFIITSDEEIKEGDLKYDIDGDIGTALGKDMREFAGDKKVIAQQDQIYFFSLPEEQLKKIGWFELNDLAFNDIKGFKPITDHPFEARIRAEEWKKGFRKAEELLSDKMFTLEDMRRVMEQGILYGRKFEWDIQHGKERFEEHNELFDKLTQRSKSWKVELEMASEWFGHPDDYSKPHGVRQIPKFTNGKINLLKVF